MVCIERGHPMHKVSDISKWICRCGLLSPRMGTFDGGHGLSIPEQAPSVA